MLGTSSLPLARLFGIRIGVNVSWFLVLFLFIFWMQDSFTQVLGDQTTGYLAAVGAALTFFGSIVLHELGHALVARREGIAVSGIDLFFFGGVMKMSRDTDSPGAEFRVAVAGPLVTLAIVILGALAGRSRSTGRQGFLDTAVLDGGGRRRRTCSCRFLVTMNMFLLVFNLSPPSRWTAGGSPARSAWRITGDRTKATRFSARSARASRCC